MAEDTLVERIFVVATLVAGTSGAATLAVITLAGGIEAVIMAVVIPTRLPLMAVILAGVGHLMVDITATARVIMADGTMATIPVAPGCQAITIGDGILIMDG